jgi:antitoxin CptB
MNEPVSAEPPDHTSPDLGAVRRRRLLFRATHRGTYENDLLVGGFVRAHLDALTEAEIGALEAVMEIPDTILADWLTGREAIPEEEQTPMLLRMKEYQLR